MQDYRKLSVWQKSYALALETYRASAAFPKEEVYGIVSQVRRAAASIPANIAEGCGRHTRSEFVRFLDIAMGSLAELDTYLMLSRDLAYIPPESYADLDSRLIEVKKMLASLITKVRQKSHR